MKVIVTLDIDLPALIDQKAKLIDSRELEEDQKYIDAFSGIIHLLDSIQDQLQPDKPYVGYRRDNIREAFMSDIFPTFESHGDQYGYV